MGKIRKTANKNDINKEVLLLAQDIKFAKSLASNNKQVRERSLKALKKWFQIRSLKMPLSEKDFTLLWKGLFYTMWMSDKPLIQEECAENISALIHLSTWEESLLFFKCGLRTVADSWFGIDQLRLDKFLMFVRRFLRQGLIILDNECWVPKVLEKFTETLSETILSTTKLPPLGLAMHFTEIFLEELAKVSKGKIKTSVTTTLLKPFIKQLALLKHAPQVSHITKFIFRHLMWQSDLAMDYNDRYNEWKKLGFPGGTIDVIQKEEISDDKIMSDNEIEEDKNVSKPLDPRAGHVDVELPQIPFDPKEIATVLKDFRFIKTTTTRNRRCITKLIGEFEQMSKGEFPLGVKQLPIIEKDHSTKLRQSVNRLVKFEKKILGKNKRKRKHSDETSVLNSVKDESEASSKIKKKKVMEKQLKEFIEKSESHLGESIEILVKKEQKETKISDINKRNKMLSKSKRLTTNLYKVEKAKAPGRKLKQIPIKNLKPEKSFHRNSGTWYVHELKPQQKEQLTEHLDNKTDSKLITLLTPSLSDSPKSNKGPRGHHKDNLEFPTPPRLNINSESPKQEQNETPELSESDLPGPNDSSRTRSRTLSENFESDTSRTSKSPTPKPDSPISQRKLNDMLASEGPVTHQVSLQNLVGGGSSKRGQKFTESIKVSNMEEKSSETQNSRVGPSKLTAKLELSNKLVTSTPKESTSNKDIKNNSFRQNEWDTPLQEGEVEIFVPAKKFQKKMEKLARQNNQSLPSLLNNSLREVRDMRRKNCNDLNLVRNPFSKMNLTGSVKKVKIALNLNKSQEIHEHIKMIKSSPAIPFDAEKKPSKPLLKKSVIVSPINPFYNNELNL